MISYDCHWHYNDLILFNWCWFPYPVQQTACNSNSPQTWHIQPKLHANDVAECRCFTRRDGSSTLVRWSRRLVALTRAVGSHDFPAWMCASFAASEPILHQRWSAWTHYISTYFNSDRSRLLQDWTPALDPWVEFQALSVLLKPYSKGKTGKKHWRIIVGCQCSQGKPALNSCF